MPDVPAIHHVEKVMGTAVSITAHPQSNAQFDSPQLIGEALNVLHAADDTFSLWKADSPMSQIRSKLSAPTADSPQTWGELNLLKEMSEVLDLCLAAREMSNGWFDPWAMPGGFDPTGLVKGWAAARAAQSLARCGARAGIVNAAGDIATFGKPSEAQPNWHIGIRHPWHAQSLACVLEIDACVATSATYERGSHLIDPFSGHAQSRLASATVVGPNLALADALATALAVAGKDGIQWFNSLVSYDAYLIGLDGSETNTSGIVFAT